MTFQILIISLQIAALAAFLILWYFWVKRKLEAAFCIEEEENVLFPFRYFSWVFVGLIVLTCVAQIHFVRVSSNVHERLAAIAGSKKPDANAKSTEELKASIEKLRQDMEAGFKSVRAVIPVQNGLEQPAETKATSAVPETKNNLKDKNALIAAAGKSEGQHFAKEAKASSIQKTQDAEQDIAKPIEEEVDKTYTMRLSRSGKAIIDNLRVRKQPSTDGHIIEKLMIGQEVKVTEKKLVSDGVWFRIITPSGKAGWVDYRYLKLDGNS